MNRIFGVIIIAAALASPSARGAEPGMQTPKPESPAIAAPTPLPAATTEAQSEAGEGLRLNFDNAPLNSVLDYLSREAGFIIVREAEVTGTVNVTSHAPVSKDEAVDLLNTVLNQNGFAAIRNGRTLTIVSKNDARTKPIPVVTGSDPDMVPQKDTFVTQIIPLRYVDAAALLSNLEPLLADYSTITANVSSNAIILTDTQTNVRRAMEIIKALDTTISAIAVVRVFPLQYADAGDTASMVTRIFQTQSSSNRRGGNPAEEFFAAFGGGGRGGGRGGGGSSGDTSARTQASQVIAEGDQRTNSVVVRAPEELMETIAETIKELDSDPAASQTVFYFPLSNADAENLAGILDDILQQNSSSNSRRTTTRGGSTTRGGTTSTTRGTTGFGGTGGTSARGTGGRGG